MSSIRCGVDNGLARIGEQNRALGIAVVGCGCWGSKHVRVVNGIPDVRVGVIVDSEPRIRAATATAFSRFLASFIGRDKLMINDESASAVRTKSQHGQ